MKLIDLTGRRYGQLRVVARLPSRNGRTMWECLCDCGNIAAVESYNLRNGHTESCGCYQKQAASAANGTHRESKTRLWRIWQCMKTRCYRPSYHAFKHYGGRGIKVCDEWREDFAMFREWALSHGYKEGLSIDRIDSNGNYCPENCRWVTMAEQNKNKRAPNGYKIKEENNERSDNRIG